MTSYISDLAKHNHSDALTITAHVSVHESIASILRYLKTVFYTGMTFSAQDVEILCNTHTLKFPMKNYTPDTITKVYWFYVCMRVYIRHDIIITDLTCTETGISYIDRLVLYCDHYHIQVDDAIQCIADIHAFISDCSEIKKLIARSETIVSLVPLDTQTPQQTTLTRLTQLTKLPKSTQGTTHIDCLLALHTKDPPRTHAENTPAGEYYAQFIAGKITEKRFFDIMNAMCVIDIYKHIPSTRRVTPEFLVEYNAAVLLIDSLL